MTSIAMVLVGCLLVLQAPPIGKADSTFDKSVNFGTLKTYQWLPGQPAFHPEVHKAIVAALEAEMAARGFTKQPSGSKVTADVSLAYYAMAVANIDLKELDKIEQEGATAKAASKVLGKLVVVMRTKDYKQIWSAATREYLEPNYEKITATVTPVVARLFATYPKPPA